MEEMSLSFEADEESWKIEMRLGRAVEFDRNDTKIR